jgi:hypothetical protein
MGEVVESHQTQGNGEPDGDDKQQHAQSQTVEKNSDKVENGNLQAG